MSSKEKWSAVGSWLKDNAGTGASLVGHLLTGNVPGAVAAGVALVTSATGESDPAKVMERLQSDPATLIELKKLAYADAANIRQHTSEMARIELEREAAELKDQQAQHEQQQATIRAGDRAEDKFVRWTRPLMAWTGLLSGLTYVLAKAEPSDAILAMLFAAPWAYMGLRTKDKITAARAPKGAA